MIHNSNFVLIPFVIAFIVFLVKFYAHEKAGSLFYPSFLLAGLSALLPVSFMLLHVLALTFPYAALIYGVVGVGLAVYAIVRFVMI